MANYIHQVLLRPRVSLVQFQRHRGKINIQRPQKPHYERARVVAVTSRIIEKPPPTINCFKESAYRLQTQIENPLNVILAREVLNWLEHSQTVGIFHLNPINADDLFKIRVALHKHNIVLKKYGRKIIERGVAGTKYEAILPLFEASHCLVFSSEQKVVELIKTTKKMPQMLLLGGIVENKFLSRNELINFANLPNIQVARAQIVSLLNTAAGQVVRNIESAQVNLINVLDAYERTGNSPTTEVANKEGAAEGDTKQ